MSQQLEEYRGYLEAILMAVAMQLRSLDEPSSLALQTAASLITLWALFGFQGLVEDPVDARLGATNILITLIRLVRLQNPRTAREAMETPDI